MQGHRKKVVGLVRVSTDQQAADDRAGLPRQRHEIAVVAAANNLEVIEIIEFSGISGTVTREMPEIHRILQMVRNRVIAGIVLADLDRLFRLKHPGDFAIFDAFQAASATIWTGTGVFDYSCDSGAMLSIMRGLFSGMELSAIKRRINGAREEKRKRGELGGFKGLLPKGIDYDYASRTWSTTPEIHVVQEAYRIVDEEGITNLMQISRLLRVNRNTLKLWLRNRLYMGIRRIDKKRGEEYPTPRRSTVIKPGQRRDRRKIDRAPEEIIERRVLEDPPVSPERWLRVQEKLAATRNRRERASTGQVQINLGRGLLVCGHCQGTIYATSGINKKYPNRPGYYMCRRNHYLAKREGQSCEQPNLRKSDVDTLLRSFVSDYLTHNETLKSILESVSRQEKPPVEKKFAISGLEQRKDRLLTLYEEGVLSVNKYKERIEAINLEQSRIQNAEAAAMQRKLQIADSESVVKQIVQGAFAFGRLATKAEQKILLDGLLSSVVVKGAAITAFRPLKGAADSISVAENQSPTGRGSSRRRA